MQYVAEIAVGFTASMMGSGMDDKGKVPDTSQLTVHYIKSNLFRVIHVDGALGSITPRGFIHAAFFSERMPIPLECTFPVEMTTGGESSVDLDHEIADQRKSKEGLIREVEIDVMFDLNSAKAFAKWLNSRISDLENMVRPPKSNGTAGVKS
jgi:hypothetical protein